MNCPATHIQSNRKDDHFSKLLVGLEQSIESPAFSSENGTFTFAEMTLLTFPFPATKVVATYRPQLILAKWGRWESQLYQGTVDPLVRLFSGKSAVQYTTSERLSGTIRRVKIKSDIYYASIEMSEE